MDEIREEELDHKDLAILDLVLELQNRGEKVYKELIARKMRIRRNDLFKRIERLVKLGYLIVERDPDDRRKILVRVPIEKIEGIEEMFIKLFYNIIGKELKWLMRLNEYEGVLADISGTGPFPGGRTKTFVVRTKRGGFRIIQIDLAPREINHIVADGEDLCELIAREDLSLDEALEIVKEFFEKHKSGRIAVQVTLPLRIRGAMGPRMVAVLPDSFFRPIVEPLIERFGEDIAYKVFLHILRLVSESLTKESSVMGIDRIPYNGDQLDMGIIICHLPRELTEESERIARTITGLISLYSKMKREGGRILYMLVEPELVKMVEEMISAGLADNPGDVVREAIRSLYEDFRRFRSLTTGGEK